MQEHNDALWPAEKVGKVGCGEAERLIEGCVTQPDQIKMWQGAKMAAWVLQYHSCPLNCSLSHRP